VQESACDNDQSTRRLFKRLLAAHPNGQPSYVVCDDARYYKNRELTAWLQGKLLA
jgi:transposase-like protein